MFLFFNNKYFQDGGTTIFLRAMGHLYFWGAYFISRIPCTYAYANIYTMNSIGTIEVAHFYF